MQSGVPCSGDRRPGCRRRPKDAPLGVGVQQAERKKRGRPYCRMVEGKAGPEVKANPPSQARPTPRQIGGQPRRHMARPPPRKSRSPRPLVSNQSPPPSPSQPGATRSDQRLPPTPNLGTSGTVQYGEGVAGRRAHGSACPTARYNDSCGLGAAGAPERQHRLP